MTACTAATKKAVPARPRLARERRDQLLDIATDGFISAGFQVASTNVIAQCAGASKASLYARFPTKQKRFLGVLERRMEKILVSVAAIIVAEAPLRPSPRGFGERFGQLILNPSQVALVRMVCMESTRFP